MKVLKKIKDFRIHEQEHVRKRVLVEKKGWFGTTYTQEEIQEIYEPKTEVSLWPKGWGKGIGWTFEGEIWSRRDRQNGSDAVYLGRHLRKDDGVEYYFYEYEGIFYLSEIKLSGSEAATMISDERNRKKEKLWREVDRVKAKVESEAGKRESISEKVQLQVWNRDKGQCVKCGSNEKLEFDHIIPVSKGGSNTARNIQLLCEVCNRAKGGNIGG